MNEIYWITRLDDIDTFLFIASIVSGLIAAISTIAFMGMKSEYTGSGYKEDKDWMNFWSKWAKGSTAVFALAAPLCVLTPNTKEALVIIGVGGTIDYIKNNDTMKQLPDKCVNTLDAWMDSLTDENKEESK